GLTMLPHMEMPGDVKLASAVSNPVDRPSAPRQPVLPAESEVDDLALPSAPRVPVGRRGSEPMLTPAVSVTGDAPARPPTAAVPPPVGDTTISLLPPPVAVAPAPVAVAPVPPPLLP